MNTSFWKAIHLCTIIRPSYTALTPGSDLIGKGLAARMTVIASIRIVRATVLSDSAFLYLLWTQVRAIKDM